MKKVIILFALLSASCHDNALKDNSWEKNDRYISALSKDERAIANIAIARSSKENSRSPKHVLTTRNLSIRKIDGKKCVILSIPKNSLGADEEYCFDDKGILVSSKSDFY